MTIRHAAGLLFFLAGIAAALADSPPTTTQPTSTTSAPATNKVSLSGVTDDATRIVYLVDHSGSLLNQFDFIREELKTSIDQLTPSQKFNIIGITQSTETLGPDGKLAPATPEIRKEIIAKLISWRVVGTCDDILEPFKDAFVNAFAMKPQVIYFVSDGDCDPKLIDMIARLNRAHATRIHVIHWGDGPTENARYADEMRKIAKDNGGKYKLMNEKEIMNPKAHP